MTEFVLALSAFMVAHLVPALPGVRARLVATAGRTAYLAVYSILSLVLLGWIVVAAGRADVVELWAPAAWQWLAPVVAMPISLALIFTGLVEPNPLSISLLQGERPAAVIAITRHPLPWGFLIWALAHVPPNGRLVPLILFGSMAALAAAGLPLLDRKARARLGEAEWRRLNLGASSIPFAAMLAGRARLRPTPAFAAALLASLAFYAWFLLAGHAWLIGPDPWSGLRAFFG
ncbi:NnrU family protein [Alsobacter sp. SYSU M60028]|uniref:NnrU family protein n=1 Tax=Alsobacter ponti TaxID=2962936 RepID=A0ABT1L9A2_9HYPH|nr:NnrU family protein [Alsobacter ponti]MCP8938055.1 NnrU family protein [Alsobacter ponti]